ncbi:hypothetical protein FACS189427_11620 [Planctomycetales bacterium]|nr:hypothetical protein FACS189427_11620 [Planctomycetales bacterium]
MKPKKKKGFDIKDFFVKHTEKIVVALLIPVACYIGYQGTLYEPLKWQPEDLKRVADEADKHIKESVRKAADEDVVIRQYDMVATWIKVGVKPDLYRTVTQWMPSLFPEKVKRAGLEPSQLYAVKDLKAYTGLGAIAINPQSDAAQAAGIITPRIGQRWTVLTGLIPVKEQLDVYVNLYSSSVQPDPMRDFPIYRLYEVERAQIEPGQTADQLKWEKIEFLSDYVKNVQLWGTTALDPVDPTYIAPGQFPMAYPLPPVDKKYGEEVAHPPFIPLLTDSQVKMNKEIEKYREKQLKNMFKVDSRDFLESDPFSGGGGMRGSEMGDGMGMGGSTLSGGTSRRKRAQEEEEDFKPVEVSNYLFRFFDFSVEPGKTYKYRIRLLLANPNFRMPPNVLTDESIAKEPILKTDFCSPTNAVTVPLESRVLVTNVTDSRSAWEDPTANILAVHFDLSDGSEWCVNKERITRGSTINYPKQKGENYVLANKPKAGAMDSGMSDSPMMEGSPPQRGRRTPPKPNPAVKPADDESKKDIDVLSDVCVLDVFGGQRLQFIGAVDSKTQDLRSPGKMVVLEPSGNLVIHKVSTDLQEVNTVKNPVAVQRGGMYGEGMMDRGSMSGP